MNTKFSFTFLAVLIVLIVAACAPAITAGSAPIVIAVLPADNQTSALMPVTGGSPSETARTESQAPRLWSGEIFLADNDYPNVELSTNASANQDLQSMCLSEDSLPLRHGGCVE
jgi:hypothetical protein